MATTAKQDFWIRVPARLAKDLSISPEARLLWVTLKAFADIRTGCTFVSPAHLDRLLRRHRQTRERAQRELVKAGWLRIKRIRDKGRIKRVEYTLVEPSSTTAAKRSTGTTAVFSSANKYSKVSRSSKRSRSSKVKVKEYQDPAETQILKAVG